MNVIDIINKPAEIYENEGGEFKVIILAGKEVKCCLDENGQIMNHRLRVLAQLTGQNES